MLNNKLSAPWSSISDMMSGLMMVFLLISVSYAYQVSKQSVVVKKQNERISEIVGEYEDYNRLIYEDLVATFGHRLDEWDAEIDEQSLAFRFNNPVVLFQPGKSNITIEFAEILQDFWPNYITIMKKYDQVIREVRIEGHTSSEWAGSTIDESYFNNMALSQSRTRTALEKCYLFTPVDDLAWVRSSVTANGMSFSKPVFTSSGEEDFVQSRRVEFTVVVDSQQKLDEISKEF